MSRSFIVLLLALVLGTGCSEDVADQGVYEPVDSRITIGLVENLNSGGRTLSLNCSTERIYGCCNFCILHQSRIDGRTVDISFTGIFKPEICATALGPAQTVIFLGPLQEGNYLLSVTVNGQAFRTDLTVTATDYMISRNSSPWVIFPHPQLMRAPEGTLWGYAGYHVASSAHIVQSFLDSLQAMGAQAHRYATGEYGYFTIDSTGAIEPPVNHGYYFIRPFIYHFPFPMSAVHDLVFRYGKNFGDSLNIGVYASHGEVLYSWVLRQEGPGILPGR